MERQCTEVTHLCDRRVTDSFCSILLHQSFGNLHCTQRLTELERVLPRLQRSLVVDWIKSLSKAADDKFRSARSYGPSGICLKYLVEWGGQQDRPLCQQ